MSTPTAPDTARSKTTPTRRGTLCRLPLAIVAALTLVGGPFAMGGGSDQAQQAESHRPNRLARESSAYLLLHAYNPVNWYPWGEEAIARSRREDKPLFVSIGYATCYWCHVMERQVFADPAIAALMNRWFVNVKVDREEHPEIDAVYITATQIMTGSAGWPNSVFLTPDLAPFFAGTFFPPADRDGLPGFPTVLGQVHEAWESQRGAVTAQAARVTERLRAALTPASGLAAPAASAADAQAAIDALKSRADDRFGGLGGPPRFPMTPALRVLWQAGQRGDDRARDIVLTALRAMGRGAIHDQLGGGFHRYTLDARWRVPHFEKMLYDNAQLAELLAIAAGATGDTELNAVARDTLEFMLRDLAIPQGAFASAIDAETEGVEGAYYTWTEDELRLALGDEGFAVVGKILGFAGEPVLENGRFTLYLTTPLDEHATRLGISGPQLDLRLQPYLEQLRLARARRPHPMTDRKVLTDWNGLAIAAFARAGAALGEPRYVAAAERAAEFIATHLVADDGSLRHAWSGGRPSLPALLDDYTFLMDGLLALHDATGKKRWLEGARTLADEMERRLAAPGGGHYLSAAHPMLLVQASTATDGAVPAGNGIAALGLLELAARTGRGEYRVRGIATLRAFAADLKRAPHAHPTLARAAMRAVDPPPSVAPAPPGRGAPTGPVSAAAFVEGPVMGDGWRRFGVRVIVAEGWHVNANPAAMEQLVPTRVGGRVRSVDYPPGSIITPSFAERPLGVYTGTVRITGEVAGGEGAVEMTYQACNDRQCLLPVTRKLPLTGAVVR